MISKLIELAEKGLIPDFMIRAGIVRNCKNRLRNESSFSKQELDAKKQKWVEQMKESPIALVPEKANIFKAILLCSPEDSIAAAIIKPPKKSNTNGCAYELAIILRSYNPKRGKEIRGKSPVA